MIFVVHGQMCFFSLVKGSRSDEGKLALIFVQLAIDYPIAILASSFLSSVRSAAEQNRSGGRVTAVMLTSFLHFCVRTEEKKACGRNVLLAYDIIAKRNYL